MVSFIFVVSNGAGERGKKKNGGDQTQTPFHCLHHPLRFQCCVSNRRIFIDFQENKRTHQRRLSARSGSEIAIVVGGKQQLNIFKIVPAALPLLTALPQPQPAATLEKGQEESVYGDG